MNPIPVGINTATKQEEFLTEQDLATHLHFVGTTRVGKSYEMLAILESLVEERLGFTLLDPKGQLARDAIAMLVRLKPRMPVVYIDYGRSDYVVPFFPFLDLDVDEATEIICRVWGTETMQNTPRLARLLPVVLELFKVGIITFNEVMELLEFSNRHLRSRVAHHIKDPVARTVWEGLLAAKSERDYQIESVVNRIYPFTKRSMRRIMGTDGLGKNFSFRKAFKEKWIVIMNLQPQGDLSVEGSRLLATLAIHELWAEARQMKYKPLKPYYIFADECADIISRDVVNILDKGAGQGLHIALAHQQLQQLKEQAGWVLSSVMGGCRTKIVFGGLHDTGAMDMSRQIFTKRDSRAAAEELIHQEPRYFYFYRPGKGAVPVYAREVEQYERILGRERVEAYTLEHFIKPYAVSVAEIDAELDRRLRAFLNAPSDTGGENGSGEVSQAQPKRKKS